MYSIYHFFASLIQNKAAFKQVSRLADFPFDLNLLSCRNLRRFPDMAIRLNTGDADFTGGELIDLKDSRSSAISSFNSTIPTGTKDLREINLSPSSKVYRQMQAAGDEVFSLPVRDMFYLIRGQKSGIAKVCLIHGSFFETIPAETLIREGLSQAIAESLPGSDAQLAGTLNRVLLPLFYNQQSIGKTDDGERASVKLRFRIMTEAKAEGNILNSVKYPAISDNTLNLILPCHSPEDEKTAQRRAGKAMSQSQFETLRGFKIRHLLNGEFLVFQTAL